MKVLVTGGAGFIGSHLIESLAQQPDVTLIRAVDNLSTGRRQNLEPVLPGIELVVGDLLDDKVREKSVRGIDVIFHQAAIPSVPRSVKAPVDSHLNGAHLTLLLLESARLAGVKRVVFAASSSAYGDTAVLPKHELLPPNPMSPYAATKLACEQYLRAYARCYDLDTVSLRYFNIFGPRQDPSSPYSGVIARFCQAYCQGGSLTIFGNGEQSRDFTYVDNAVQANLLAARHPQRLGGEVLNIGAGERTSLNQLVALLDEITGQKLTPEYRPARPGDVLHSLADVAKGRDCIGYSPRVSVKRGLLQTFAWYRQQYALRSTSNAA